MILNEVWFWTSSADIQLIGNVVILNDKSVKNSVNLTGKSNLLINKQYEHSHTFNSSLFIASF